MPARRLLTMRHLRRILRLHHEGASARDIVRAVGMARSTVQDALKRAAAANPHWNPGEKAAHWLVEASHYRMRAHAALEAAIPALSNAAPIEERSVRTAGVMAQRAVHGFSGSFI